MARRIEESTRRKPSGKLARRLRAGAFTLGLLNSAVHLPAAHAQETTVKENILSHEDLIKDPKTRELLFNSLKGSVATTLNQPDPEPQNSTPGTYIKIAEKPVVASGITTQETRLLLSLTPKEFSEIEKTSPVYAEHARYRIAKFLAATSKSSKLNGLENDEGVKHYLTVIKASKDIDPFSTMDTPHDPRAYTQARAVRETCATETTGYRELLSRGICLAKMLEKARQLTDTNRANAAKTAPTHLDAIEELLPKIDEKIAKTITSKVETLRAQLTADKPDPGLIAEHAQLISKAEARITDETPNALKLRLRLRELTDTLAPYVELPGHELTVLDQLDQLRTDANPTKLPSVPAHLLNGFTKWVEIMQARAALERHGSRAIIKLYPDFDPRSQRAYLTKQTSNTTAQQDAVRLNVNELAAKYDKNIKIQAVIPTHPYDF